MNIKIELILFAKISSLKFKRRGVKETGSIRYFNRKTRKFKITRLYLKVLLFISTFRNTDFFLDRYYQSRYFFLIFFIESVFNNPGNLPLKNKYTK